jgi:hypothetical protein
VGEALLELPIQFNWQHHSHLTATLCYDDRLSPSSHTVHQPFGVPGQIGDGMNLRYLHGNLRRLAVNFASNIVSEHVSNSIESSRYLGG